MGGGSKLAKQYREQLAQIFQTFNTDLKHKAVTLQNGLSNNNVLSTQSFSVFFPDCIAECLFPIFLQENPKLKT